MTEEKKGQEEEKYRSIVGFILLGLVCFTAGILCGGIMNDSELKNTDITNKNICNYKGYSYYIQEFAADLQCYNTPIDYIVVEYEEKVRIESFLKEIEKEKRELSSNKD